MDKIMDRPWFLRFTALFLAIVLFFSVQTDEGSKNGNAAGDQRDIIRDIPVEVYYDDENLVVTGVPETVNVTIEGPINLVQTTKLLKDFTLFVDLRTLTMGKHSVDIKYENISEKLQVRIDPESIDVEIEEKITQMFPVEAELNKQQLAPDFYVDSMEVIPSEVEVTGAKSVIESISFVKATVSGEEGINQSFEQEAKVRVLDKDLNKLDIIIVPETVKVKVNIVENKVEVPIVLKTTGTPPDGVSIDSVSSETDMITLFGPSSILNEIKEFGVEIDVSKIDKSGTVEVNLKKPKGVSSISMTTIKVDVKATVKEAIETDETDDVDEEKEEVVLKTEDEDIPSTETKQFENVQVAITGLDEKFTSTLLKPESGSLTLTITAEPDIIEKLVISDFTVSIDASETVDEGERVYPVTVKGPDNIEWALSDDEVTMQVELA